MKTPRLQLTRTQMLAAEALATGKGNQKSIAFGLGIGYRTLNRWCADPRFQEYRESVASTVPVPLWITALCADYERKIDSALRGQLNPRSPEYREARRRFGEIHRGRFLGFDLSDCESVDAALNHLFRLDTAVAERWGLTAPNFEAFVGKRTKIKPGRGRRPDW